MQREIMEDLREEPFLINKDLRMFFWLVNMDKGLLDSLSQSAQSNPFNTLMRRQ